MMSQPPNNCRDPRLNATIQGRLGRRLRAVYRGFTREPVPLEQIELLLALRRAERERHHESIRGHD
jgi:hypothetical protein